MAKSTPEAVPKKQYLTSMVASAVYATELRHRLDREYEEADITCCALSQDLLDELGISQEEAVRLAQLASIPEEVIMPTLPLFARKAKTIPPLPTPY